MNHKTMNKTNKHKIRTYGIYYDETTLRNKSNNKYLNNYRSPTAFNIEQTRYRKLAVIFKHCITRVMFLSYML